MPKYVQKNNTFIQIILLIIIQSGRKQHTHLDVFTYFKNQ